MLDHVFTDAIAALRDAFEDALLERQAGEERFQTDVLAPWTAANTGMRASSKAVNDRCRCRRLRRTFARRLPISPDSLSRVASPAKTERSIPAQK